MLIKIISYKKLERVRYEINDCIEGNFSPHLHHHHCHGPITIFDKITRVEYQSYIVITSQNLSFSTLSVL